MLALGAYFGGHCARNEKKYFSHFGVQTRPGGWGGSSDHQNKTAPLPILLLASGETQKIFWCARSAKNILVYLCSRPAPGRVWGFWHSYHQNKSVPEPPLPILLMETICYLPNKYYQCTFSIIPIIQPTHNE